MYEMLTASPMYYVVVPAQKPCHVHKI